MKDTGRKGKAKFRVGQVVAERTTGIYFKLGSKNWQGRWFYWNNTTQSVGWEERELRPLTKRERGA